MSDVAAGSNPFATRFTRPGAIAFLFPDGETVQTLVDRLQAQAWRGEIVGPLGAGKSTLLATLTEPLAAAGRKVIKAALHQGESSLPDILDDWRVWDAATQVIVDGYEQLSWWSRRQLAQRVRDRQAGLLVTSHAPTGLPTILTVVPRVESAWQVVQQLVPPSSVITRDDVEQTFAACQGNVREMLFQLFDLYQARAPENR
jgi:molybdopterin-guanine dinucleotide biosynthesis protein